MDPYIVKRKDFQVGHIYTPWKDAARKDPAHWHNSYYIPIESHGRSKFTMLSFNKAWGAGKSHHTDSWNSFIRKSMFKDVSDDPKVRRKIVTWILEPQRKK